MSEAEIQTVEIDWHREAYAKLNEAYRLLVAENLRLKDALARIEDVTSANKEDPCRPLHSSYADWELRNIAREAMGSEVLK